MHAHDPFLLPAVMVADDSSDNREILRTMLEDEGYPVVFAANGHEVVRKATPDLGLILLDICMPLLDGIRACALLKANPATRDIPVLFLSGADDEATVAKALRTGGIDFLSKPVTATELRIKVGAVARMKRVAGKENQYSEYIESLRGESLNDLRESGETVRMMQATL